MSLTGGQARTRSRIPLTAVILTKNEESAIGRSVEAALFCDQIVVVDSGSTDGTVDIARECGAEVVQFIWNGDYPKKKQWSLQHGTVRHDWVLMLDADEIVSPSLQREIRALFVDPPRGISAYDIPLEYHFSGRALRHGHRVMKRSLLDRRHTRFPEVGDLAAPGITEVEGHYQPVTDLAIGRLNSFLIHDDPDPLCSWVSRHNRYSDWEVFLRTHPMVRSSVRQSRSPQGRIFDAAPFKPAAFFVYSYVIRLGFLDGRAGFDYAYALAFYYWLINAKIREHGRNRAPDRGAGLA
jgi:glycosyltransferase involved in cell wall biosynthesis